MTEVSTTGRSMSREPVRWGFASPGPLRDKLTALAIGGGKVVTTGLLAEYEIEGDPVEQPGDISILLDSRRPTAGPDRERPLAQGHPAGGHDRRGRDQQRGGLSGYRGLPRVARGPLERFHRRGARRAWGPGATRSPTTRSLVAERFRIAGLLDGRRHDRSTRRSARPTRPIARSSTRSWSPHNADVVARLGTLEDATTTAGADRRRPMATLGRCPDVGSCVGRSMEVLTLHAARANGPVPGPRWLRRRFGSRRPPGLAASG